MEMCCPCCLGAASTDSSLGRFGVGQRNAGSDTEDEAENAERDSLKVLDVLGTFEMQKRTQLNWET